MAKIYSCALFILVSTIVSQGKIRQQHNPPSLPKGYYVVVAAFFSNQEDFAQRYSSKLNEGGHHAKYGLDPTRKLYFVYLDQYDDFNESVQQMLKMRKEGSFDKAWVRVIKEGVESDDQGIAKKEEPRVQEATSTPAPQTKNEEPKIVTEKKTGGQYSCSRQKARRQ